MSDEQPARPPEKLQPGSWTEAEVDAMQGRRVRFKNSGASGSGEGTVEVMNEFGVSDEHLKKVREQHAFEVEGEKDSLKTGCGKSRSVVLPAPFVAFCTLVTH